MMASRKQVGAGVGAWIALLMVAGSAGAQTPAGPLSLTMDDAVRMGVEHAPRLAEARARGAAAETSVSALKALGYPSANVSMQYVRWNHIEEFLIPNGLGGKSVFYPDIPNVYKGHAEISVPVYSFGRVASNVAAARSDVDAAHADERATEADVRLDVMRAYWTLATMRESVNVLVQSLARTDAWVGDVKSRVEAGLLPPNEVLSAQAQRARQQVRLLQAQNEAALAELDLARMIGVPAGTPIRTTSQVDHALPRAGDLEAMPIDELVTRAADQRGERAGLLARGEGLRQASKAAMANLNPYALAAAVVEPARPNARFVPPIDELRTSWTLDFKIVWPFFDGGRSKAQAAGFTAQAQAIDARRDELDGLVALEIRQRLLDLQFGRAAVAASEEGVAAAAEARRVVGERFDAGVATSTEVLDAQVALLEAELERTRLNAGLRLSEARLLRAVGER